MTDKVNHCESHLHPRDGGPPKKRFHSRTKAEAAIRTIRRGSDRSVIPGRAYRCPGCGDWFLTSKPGDERDA